MSDDDSGSPEPFYTVADHELRQSIIREWQECMHTDTLKLYVCAVCARRTKRDAIEMVSISSLDVSLLRNDQLPAHVLPSTYAYGLYGRALLHPAGMTSLWEVADIRVCVECRIDLVDKKRMPKYALANWLYYGIDELPPLVRAAFASATRCEKVLIARARSSKISFRFSDLRKDEDLTRRENPVVSQWCVKGNILVMPQNVTQMHDVLPPSEDALRDTICAVFVGRTQPTLGTIARLAPMLARKSRIRFLIEFLAGNNVHYSPASGFGGLSEQNLAALFGPDHVSDDEGVPCSVEIGFLEQREGTFAAESDYSGRDRFRDGPGPGDDLLMETVGYTDSSDSPMTYNQMKLKALAHCLSGGRFVRSQAGSRFVPDFENPSLLSWLFPHLDPWGIGGFFEPARSCKLTLEEQLKYLLRVHESPFERDPDFAFVYYNIYQKKRVCETVSFRVKASQQQEVVRDLLTVDTVVLQRLIERFKGNSFYEPTDPAERDIMRVMTKVSMVGRDLPGTAGYKMCLRNEIRSLVYFKGTPALFVTLNPSDVHNPLVRLYMGHDIRLEDMEHGMELTEWQRRILVANNPAACVMAFHEVISAFIRVVLRCGLPNRGLFG
ncbi:hypothetical protein K466DRAFT_490148, partial [Polyporus arcularius HHB13444]